MLPKASSLDAQVTMIVIEIKETSSDNMSLSLVHVSFQVQMPRDALTNQADDWPRQQLVM